MASIIITGTRALDRELSALPVKVQKKAIRQATRKSTKIVLQKAKQLVPVDTGTLHDTLTVRTARGLKRGEMGHTVLHVERKTTDDPFYAPFVAFGTKKWPITEPSQTGDRRYLQEALYGQASRIRAIFRDELKTGVERIAAEWRATIK